MENPWKLSNERVFNIHPSDEWYVGQHNRKTKPDQEIQRSLPPLPFLGNPLTARVVLLGKNPSYSEADEEDLERLPSIETANWKTLLFESEFPFFYLAPEFRDTNGYVWWWNVLGDVVTACEAEGLDPATTLGRIACIQWHPYRSKQSFTPATLFPTQDFSFHLAQMAADAGKLFLLPYGTVNERQWREKVPDLPQDCIRLRSAQNAKISRGNMSSQDFDRLIRTLCA